MTLLKNEDNVCFANSIVCMLSNAPFVHSFLDRDLEGTVYDSLSKLLTEILEDRKKHGKQMELGKSAIFDVMPLLKAMHDYKE